MQKDLNRKLRELIVVLSDATSSYAARNNTQLFFLLILIQDLLANLAANTRAHIRIGANT